MCVRVDHLCRCTRSGHWGPTGSVVHNPLHLPRKTTSKRPKVIRTRRFLALLTWKCALRNNSVHFFDIATSKSGLRPWVFDTFDLEMCFAPQRRALLRHRNFSDIATSQSAPRLRCFVRFHLEMCFAPHPHAIFNLSSGQLAPHPPL